ncbi:MAG: hypothetical protein AMXMBFR36_29040 [Acidobacteriota bacterium]
MTAGAIPVAARLARPSAAALLADRPIDPATALGRLFAPAHEVAAEVALVATVAAAPRRLLGDAADALRLLPQRERERAAILAAWFEALGATAGEGDPVEARLARLHRSAYLLARGLAGEPSDAPFVRAFAAENERRSFTRPALDTLIAGARRAIEHPRPAHAAEWEARLAESGGAFATALAGTAASPATIEAVAALARLHALAALPVGLAAGRCQLPVEALPEPLQYRTRQEIAAAVAGECDALRPQMLRGARALAEVPLTFRRALAWLLSTGFDLLGRIEVHPEALAAAPARLSWWTRHATLWRIRRQPLD